MPGRKKLPSILDATVKRIKANSPGVNPYAAATSTLQKAGELRSDSNTATKLGTKRGAMSRAQRHKHPL
jgi:hypothetical protein